MNRLTTTLRTHLPHTLFVLGLALFAAAPAIFLHTSRVHAAGGCSPGSVALKGDAWAGFQVPGNPVPPGVTPYPSGPGWISFSGSNYQVCEDSSGNLSGYAWANPGGSTSNPEYGWVDFTNVSGCPISVNPDNTISVNPDNTTCAPKVDLATGKVSGWARFDFASGGTSGTTGWISLTGSTYGITQGASYGPWSGYAWGDTAIGWINTKGGNYGVAPAASPITVYCTVLPASGDTDTNSSFTWTATASGGAGFGSYTYTWKGDTDPASSPHTTTDPINSITTQYTTPGPKNVTVKVADTHGNSSLEVYCTNATYTGTPGPTTSNPPPPGAGVTVYQAPTLKARPTEVVSGQSTNLKWNANGNSCVVAGQAGENSFSSTAASNTNPPGDPSGPITTPGCTAPTCTSTFTMSCKDPSGDVLPTVTAPVTVDQPNVTIGANPTRVAGSVSSPGSSKIFWTSTHTNYCDVTGSNGFSKLHTGTNPNTDSPGNGDPTQGYDSGAITQQTVFTIKCQTTASLQISNSVIVNILPVFQQF
ncbi:MAG: hypothetical protein ACYC75_00215 [Minisyncoccota bacterium]